MSAPTIRWNAKPRQTYGILGNDSRGTLSAQEKTAILGKTAAALSSCSNVASHLNPKRRYQIGLRGDELKKFAQNYIAQNKLKRG